MYGFGETPHPDHPLTLDDYATGVRDLLDASGIEETILVAHSFGGRVALRLAAKDPRVKGLVLIDSAGMPPRRSLGYYIRVFSYKLAKRFGIEKKGAGSADYAALSGAMRRTFVNIVNTSSVADAKSITVPTLLLWGEKDADTPLYMCRRLRRLIRGSEAVVLRGAGHFSYLERAGEAYRIVRAFCRSI